ncbi:hypothetical protein CRG98_030638 [Punica granatum]|uniref:Uncharacterized protein n=1 Tax=Punica granatum TaxID=22663 RepID=A0A2I0IYB3_PUNGR|nr:hypothetical protein CRG98_030638 [Punica granatum]
MPVEELSKPRVCIVGSKQGGSGGQFVAGPAGLNSKLVERGVEADSARSTEHMREWQWRSASRPKAQCGIVGMNHTTHLDFPNNAKILDALFPSLEVQSQQTEITVISRAPKQLRKQSEKSSFGLLGHLRLHICITSLRFSCRSGRSETLFAKRPLQPPPETIRVDPITLGANDHHGHLEGSLGYPGPLTLPQNSIESLRGDIRLDLCQSDLFSVPAGSVCAIRVCSSKNSRNSTQKRSNLNFCGLIPHPGTRYDHSGLRGARTFTLSLRFTSKF